jgi:hypothetical protein
MADRARVEEALTRTREKPRVKPKLKPKYRSPDQPLKAEINRSTVVTSSMYGLRANMKPISILPLAIVLAATSAIGQDVVLHRSPNPTPSSFSFPRTLGDNCPVDLEVNHGPSFQKKNTDYGPFAPPIPAVQEQRIQLTMTNPSRKEIVSAQITVHGFSDKWRAVPLANAASTPDLTKRITIVLNVKGNDHASSDLSLQRFTSVAYVDLDSLTYADGATWKASSPSACSVSPDPLMLVSEAR